MEICAEREKKSELLKSALLGLRIAFGEDVSLKEKTWIRRGGVARFFVMPSSKEELRDVVKFCFKNAIEVEIVGATSNCYFVADYNPLIVVSTIKVNKIHWSNEEVVCDAGVAMVKLGRLCIQKGISGYEGFPGLPGTAGAAVVNNSGSYGSLTSNLVLWIEMLKENGEVCIVKNEELGYRHRSSRLKRGEVKGCVLSAAFRIDTARVDAGVLTAKAAELTKIRQRE